MDELLQQLIGRLRGMWHRRWIGLAVAWIVGIVAVGIALRIPERYEATARVYVDTQSLLRPLMAGLAIQPNLDQQVALMSRTLISRPNVEKLLHMADLDLRIRSAAEREEVIDNLMKQLQLSGQRDQQSLRDLVSESEPGKGEERRPVAAHDLRRVEPRGQAARHPQRDEIRRRADEGLRGEPAGSGGSPQAIQVEIPRRHRTRSRLFRQIVEIEGRHRKRAARAQRGGTVARCVQGAARGHRPGLFAGFAAACGRPGDRCADHGPEDEARRAPAQLHRPAPGRRRHAARDQGARAAARDRDRGDAEGGRARRPNRPRTRIPSISSSRSRSPTPKRTSLRCGRRSTRTSASSRN